MFLRFWWHSMWWGIFFGEVNKKREGITSILVVCCLTQCILIDFDRWQNRGLLQNKKVNIIFVQLFESFAISKLYLDWRLCSPRGTRWPVIFIIIPECLTNSKRENIVNDKDNIFMNNAKVNGHLWRSPKRHAVVCGHQTMGIEFWVWFALNKTVLLMTFHFIVRWSVCTIPRIN